LEENKKILTTLKILENKLDKELESQKKHVLANNSVHSKTDQLKIAE
jgi:hypothetical protein